MTHLLWKAGPSFSQLSRCRIMKPNQFTNVRYFSTPSNEEKCKTSSSSHSQHPKVHIPEVAKLTEAEKKEAEFIKDILKHEARPRIAYRRQNYETPFQRAFGILADDFRIMSYNTRYVINGIYRMFRGHDPETGKPTAKNEQKDNNNIASASNDSLSSKSDLNTGIKVQKNEILKKSIGSNIPITENFVNKISGIGEDKQPIRKLINKLTPPSYSKVVWPSDCDVLIIGGGAVGSSIAYHLKEKARDGLSIVVVEKDPTYAQSSTVLSVGGIRQQFSLPENVMLSLYGMKFMRNMHRHLEVDGDPPPSVNFQPHGYLTLASEKGVDQLKENLYVQQHFNARVKYMERKGLKEAFPWMNCSGLAGGVMGLENEGWFDPWSLLMGLRRKAQSLGVTYIHGEMTDAEYHPHDVNTFTDGHPTNSEKKIKGVTVRLPDGEYRTIDTAGLIMATGHATGDLCYEHLGFGKAKEGLMAYPVPIEPRKRYVYSFHAPKGPGLATPLVIDPSGAYFRREGLGNMYIGGMSPTESEEPLTTNLDVDHDYFNEQVWPILAGRVPAFEELKVQGSWAGFYEYNMFDQNGFIGQHPMAPNVFMAAGFSGHGIQHALGVGRGMMELFMFSEYKTIDLSRFGFDRVYHNEPMYELCCV